MKLDWAQLKTAIERGIHSAEVEERGGVRVHCGAAERMLKGAKDPTAKLILEKVHHAKTAIDISTSVTYLREAQELALQMA